MNILLTISIVPKATCLVDVDCNLGVGLLCYHFHVYFGRTHCCTKLNNYNEGTFLKVFDVYTLQTVLR